MTGPFRFADPEAREHSAELLLMPEATAADWATVFAYARVVRCSRSPGSSPCRPRIASDVIAELRA